MSIEANGIAVLQSKRMASAGEACEITVQTPKKLRNSSISVELGEAAMFASLDTAELQSICRVTFVCAHTRGIYKGSRVCSRQRLSRRKVQTMLTITPRAARVSMPIPIMFRRTGEEDWLAGKVVNLSESGVLFGPTELAPGTMVEVLLSPAVQVGTLTIGKQVCAAEVVRASDIGATAVRFDECRFLLE